MIFATKADIFGFINSLFSISFPEQWACKKKAPAQQCAYCLPTYSVGGDFRSLVIFDYSVANFDSWGDLKNPLFYGIMSTQKATSGRSLRLVQGGMDMTL